jgi:hypothetical protein
MHDSIRRVTAVIHGEVPDRAPLFDLLRNDVPLANFLALREAVFESVYS